MNINVLIDAIVRQTTVLIAQLATSAGARATLSQTANQVFIDLVAELKNQGLTNKLIADMFGLSLRTYHNKIQRLSESMTQQGESLWNAVLAFIRERGTATRGEVLVRFSRHDQATVKSVGGLRVRVHARSELRHLTRLAIRACCAGSRCHPRPGTGAW